MPETSRNIARLLRTDSFLNWCGPFGVSDSVIGAIDGLYGEPEKSLETRSGGQWLIHERAGFSVPFFLEEDRKMPRHGFCAVYYKKDKPITLFLGSLDGRLTFSYTVKELSENVLEQRRFFAWPPRRLAEGEGERYGQDVGFYSAMGITASVAAAFFVGSFSENVNEFNGFLRDVPPITWLFMCVGFAGSIFGGVEVAKRIGKKLGPVADRFRTRNLPGVAFSYLYGDEASNAVLEERSTLEEELRKTRLYEKFIEADVPISKPLFLEVYRAMQSVNREKIVSLSDYLARHPEKIPLEKVVNVFSSVEGL
ncbi:hypothetical protein HYT57_05295 [Candidatus Woesearchaeota archaeon]|nr:hypothetical protein [Candidatus Woesearchaeota archaeon]